MTVHIAFLDRYADTIRETAERLTPHDWRAVFARSPRREDQVAAVRDADAIFTGASPVDAGILDAAPRVRLVQKLGAGVDKIDADACRGRGVAVARLAGGNSVPVAEHAVLLMLATLRRLPELDRRTREGAWAKEEARASNRALAGKTVGLVGLGGVGRAVAQRLHGFGVDLVYHDPVRPEPDLERALGLRHAGLDDLLRVSDIVSLHAPFLPETRGLIDAGALALMKDGAFLVNCGRGGLVDEDALAAELGTGRLSGAGLDVFVAEPPRGSPLLALANTVVTPHAAAATIDDFGAVLRRAFANAEAVLREEPLPSQDIVVAPAPSNRPAAGPPEEGGNA